MNVALSKPVARDDALAAVRTVAARHEALRTTFTVGDGNPPEQVISPLTPFQVYTHDYHDEDGWWAFVDDLHLHEFGFTEQPFRVWLVLVRGLVRTSSSW